MKRIKIRYRRSLDSDGDVVIKAIASHPDAKSDITVTANTQSTKPSDRQIGLAEREAASAARMAMQDELNRKKGR